MERKKPLDLLQRTFAFSAEILRFCRALPPGAEIGMIKRQLIRSGTSVGANYRAAQRAKSRRDFIHKLGTVEEEADECVFWLDLLAETGLAAGNEISPLRQEAGELLAIIVTSRKTARKKSTGSEGRKAK